MIKNALILLLVLVTSSALFAQNEGDALFDIDQVITIDFTFTQPSYWDSLVDNYATSSYMVAGMTITDAMGVQQFDSVGIRIKGNSSYNHPNDKKSFKIDINEYTSGLNYHGLKKINLNNSYKDPSFLREKIYFDLCREMGVLAPRINFANVYMNGTLWGFYTVGEQVDDQFLDRWIGDDDGNLFDASDNFGTTGTDADLVWYGSAQSAYANRYELKTNETVNDWTDLIDLIDLINNSTDANLEALLPAQFEYDELALSLALDNIFANLDTYINSSRNYKIYHNSTSGLWEWIKWDANESFGTYSAGQNNLLQLDPDYSASDRPLLERIISIPGLNETYYTKYCEALDLFTNAHLDPKIDALKTLIQSSVYADPNKMYTDALFDSNITSDVTTGGGPGGGTIYGLKSFITQRGSYLSSALDCSLYTSVNELESAEAIRVYPNPTTDVLRVILPESNGNISVFNTLGVLVQQMVVNTNEVSISNLENGSYVLMYEGIGQRQQLRFVKH